MKKVNIEDATNAQLDYAAGCAQWDIHKGYFIAKSPEKIEITAGMILISDYAPTANTPAGHFQCSKLIDEFGISTVFKGTGWIGKIGTDSCLIKDFDDSRQIAAVKAFLWSKHPDGMVEVCDEI